MFYSRSGGEVTNEQFGRLPGNCGSHVMMVKPGYEYTLSVPQHSELGPGLLRKLTRQADLTVEEFNSL